MKLRSLVMSALVVVTAMAQTDVISTLPSCAQTCLIKSLSTTKCLPTDLACLCKDEKFFAAVAACNAGACSVIEQLDATNKTFALCQIPVHSQRETLMGVGLSFGCFAVVMISLRLLYRGFSHKAIFGWDDMLIAASGIVSVGMYGTSIAATVLGFGRDTWSISPGNLTAIFKQLYASYICFMLAEALCQLSILAFYLRIMVNRRLRLAVFVLGGFVAAFGIANTFSMIFYCMPIRGFWEGWKGLSPGAYKCIDIHKYAFIRGGIQIFFDLAILSLPLPMLAKLQMDRRKKLQIMSMFCIGFVITIVSCLRLWAFIKFAKTHNPMYDNSAALYWSGIECSLYQVVACMPAIPGIVRAAIHPVRTLRSTTKSSNIKESNSHDSKDSYARRSGRGKSGEDVDSLELRIITKSTEFAVYRSDKSDVEIGTFYNEN